MLKLTFNNYSVNVYLIELLLRILTIIHLSNLMNQGLTWKTTDFFNFFPLRGDFEFDLQKDEIPHFIRDDNIVFYGLRRVEGGVSKNETPPSTLPPKTINPCHSERQRGISFLRSTCQFRTT